MQQIAADGSVRCCQLGSDLPRQMFPLWNHTLMDRAGQHRDKRLPTSKR